MFVECLFCVGVLLCLLSVGVFRVVVLCGVCVFCVCCIVCEIYCGVDLSAWMCFCEFVCLDVVGCYD